MPNCPATLPLTGSDPLLLVAVGALALVLGGILVRHSRRRPGHLAVVALLALSVVALAAPPAVAQTPDDDCSEPSALGTPESTTTEATTTTVAEPTTTTTTPTSTSTSTTSTTTTTTTTPCTPPQAIADEVFLLLNDGDTATGNVLTNDSLGTPPTSIVLANQLVMGVIGQTPTESSSITMPRGEITLDTNGDLTFVSNGTVGESTITYGLVGCASSSHAGITVIVSELN